MRCHHSVLATVLFVLFFMAACFEGARAQGDHVLFTPAEQLREKAGEVKPAEQDYVRIRMLTEVHGGQWSTREALHTAGSVFIGMDFRGLTREEVVDRLGSEVISPSFSDSYIKRYGGSNTLVYAVDTGSASIVMRCTLDDHNVVVTQEIMIGE